ncbi:hypothetical protein ACFVR6_08465 [Microbacterium sp. NPDC058021]|uniref:hypothetical protein n=1 Tax=Microbacterium sp. NPDC058021 TaxID=3346306 RepID=UPI0036DB91D0
MSTAPLPADVATHARNAIAWAMRRVGSTAYATRCLAFVEDAIERANALELFGGDDAHESAELYDAAANTGVPPAGALVFYDAFGELLSTHRNWGHVGLALGDGDVIHAWDRVRVDGYRGLAALTPAPGWESPRFVGWAPLARVLEGSIRREWPADDDPAETASRMQTDRFAPRSG